MPFIGNLLLTHDAYYKSSKKTRIKSEIPLLKFFFEIVMSLECHRAFHLALIFYGTIKFEYRLLLAVQKATSFFSETQSFDSKCCGYPSGIDRR